MLFYIFLKLFFNFVNIRGKISYFDIREILVGKTIETSKSTTKLARMEFSIKLRIICIPQTNVCQHSPLLRDDKFHVYPSFRSLHIPIKIDQRLDKKKYFACWNRYIFFLAILTREL